ncbi:MAG: SDR family NAD(P)-dependent oxidoreductase, partial [Pseudomonadota bacterium]
LGSGGTVCLWDRDTDLLAKTVESLGPSAHAVTADIGIAESVAAATTESVARLGRIDILVNNAAIVGPNMPTWEYPDDAFADVLRIGLTGTFFVSKAIVPHMIAAGYGRIVNVASIAGKEGNPNAVAYSATKAGVISLTKSLGKELAEHDIAVNCVTPAVAKTTLAMQQSESHIAYLVSKIPRGRMLELSEAAAMIAWLATEENSFTTGGVFDLSGGRATY